MFYEWVAHGAEIGVTAFFALAVLALMLLALYGMMTVMAKALAPSEARRRAYAGKNR